MSLPKCPRGTLKQLLRCTTAWARGLQSFAKEDRLSNLILGEFPPESPPLGVLSKLSGGIAHMLTPAPLHTPGARRKANVFALTTEMCGSVQWLSNLIRPHKRCEYVRSCIAPNTVRHLCVLPWFHVHSWTQKHHSQNITCILSKKSS